jgi:hypothetical protein
MSMVKGGGGEYGGSDRRYNVGIHQTFRIRWGAGFRRLREAWFFQHVYEETRLAGNEDEGEDEDSLFQSLVLVTQ